MHRDTSSLMAHLYWQLRQYLVHRFTCTGRWLALGPSSLSVEARCHRISAPDPKPFSRNNAVRICEVCFFKHSMPYFRNRALTLQEGHFCTHPTCCDTQFTNSRTDGQTDGVRFSSNYMALWFECIAQRDAPYLLPVNRSSDVRLFGSYGRGHTSYHPVITAPEP